MAAAARMSERAEDVDGRSGGESVSENGKSHGRFKRSKATDGGEKSFKGSAHSESSQILSDTTRTIPVLKISTNMPLKDSSNVASAKKAMGRTRLDLSVSRIDNGQSSSSPRKSRLEIESDKTFNEDDLASSSVSRSIKHKSKPASKTSVTEQKSIHKKKSGEQFVNRKELWWLKLPYVIAIYLHKGPDRNAPRGLYSIKMNSPENDGSYPSYTVAFQDRGDATNFCYIFESFFEDLGDISADIVPLATQELVDAVKMGASKVIVVRKGQLRLYAGQPLTEVESELCSLVDYNLQ